MLRPCGHVTGLLHLPLLLYLLLPLPHSKVERTRSKIEKRSSTSIRTRIMMGR